MGILTMVGQPREAVEPDGSVIRCSPIAEVRDEAHRRQETILGYERVRGGDATVEDRPWVLHWYSQNTFRALAASVGLATVMVLDPEGDPAAETADAFAFWLHVAP